MTAMPTTPEGQLSQLLGCTIEQLDISIDDFLAAEQRYNDVGKYLAERGADIYVQGSVMLGTVVRPYGRAGQYDLDLVCKWNIAKQSTTQKELKDRTGDHLLAYIDQAEGVDGEVPTACTDSRRCWTLDYPRFHMDVLPSIPDVEATSDTAILLTDKKLYLWQHSDPLAYVNWFRGRCAQQFLEERQRLAKSLGTVDEVPAWRVRTPLHRVVQVLKRHRDVHFHPDPDDKPPSSLITTLAALAYRGEQDLLAATLAVVHEMPRFIENRNGMHWVENPVSEGENFADKWNDYPERRMKFYHWLTKVTADLEGILTDTGRSGAPAVHRRLEEAFGAEPVRKALGVIGDQARGLREAGRLRMGDRGRLTVGTGLPVPDHRFFGGPTPA